MFKKILFQVHWFVGITLGTMLAFSGLTGGLMAFGPELTDLLSGAYTKIEAQPSKLSAAALYAKISEANPEKKVTELMLYEDPQRLARVQFAAPPGPMGPTGPRPETRFANPYTGELSPAKPLGRGVELFMSFLRDIHQGHWSGPGTISKIAATLVGLGAVFLFLMALSGLYMRWPRGVAARKWRTWFKINPKLKGRAFLWNLHTVLGTCVFLVYLVIAHSGAFQNGEMSWYGNSVRAMVGLEPMAEGGPPGGGPEMGGPPANGGVGGPSTGAGPFGGPAMPPWPQGVSVIYMNDQSYIDADAVAIDARSTWLNPATGAEAAVATPVPKSFGEKLAANNQIIHEGRIFGKAGVLIVMLAALCMPVFYISGWMMYLERRRKKRSSLVRSPAVNTREAARTEQIG